jgi:DNA-binding transcriptional LysR family regulator
MKTQSLRMRQIEVLHAVMSSHSISAAARVLRISQPAVSRTIQRLEDTPGAVLFERRRGRLLPTVEALRINAEIDQIITRVDSLNRRITDILAGDDLLFRVGAAPSVSRRLVPMAIGKIAQKTPSLTIFLDTLFSAESLEYLINGPGECAVTTAPIHHPAIATHPLGAGELLAAVPRHHSLAAKTTIAATDLKGVDMIGFIDQQGPHGRAATTYLQSLDSPPRFRTYARFAESALALVNEGLGVLLIDSFSVGGALGQNVVIRPLVKPLEFPLFLHWNPDRPKSRYVEQFRQALKSAVTEIARKSKAEACL